MAQYDTNPTHEHELPPLQKKRKKKEKEKKGALKQSSRCQCSMTTLKIQSLKLLIVGPKHQTSRL